MDDLPLTITLLVAGYLIGSLPMGVIVARISGGTDPRTVGSGRTGGTNALRAMGWPRALLVGLLDLGKGAVPILLAGALGGPVAVQALTGVAAVLGARYVFQPRLAFLLQTMTDRWKVPALDIRVSQTRSSIMRLSLQLWDAESGELVWASVAETNMANEAVSQDPVYLEDIARATLGSMISDLLHGKTASQYTPLNTFLNDLIQEAMPKEKSNDSGKETSPPADKDTIRR